ncbi:MAG: hypothetical protein R3C01_17005 [Planctomycetaceae bacterium]
MNIAYKVVPETRAWVIRRLVGFLLLTLWLICVAGVRGDDFPTEQFRLTVPGNPNLSSNVSRTGETLVITDAQGTRYLYRRQVEFDTADRGLLGYYCADADVSLRWPASGAGAMYLSDGRGRRWVASQQQVSPVRVPANQMPVIQPGPGRPGPLIPGNKGTPGDDVRGVPPRPVRPLDRASGVMNVAWTTDHRGELRAAQIGDDGRLRLYRRNREGQWNYQTEVAASGLVAGGALASTRDVVPGQLRFFTVNRFGALTEINEAAVQRPVALDLSFVPGGNLAIDDTDRNPFAFAVDRSGRLWNLDLFNGVHTPIDNTEGRFPPGASVSLWVENSGAGRPGLRLLHLTDRQGAIWRYRQSRTGWERGEMIADGFLPGGAVGFSTIQLPGDVVTQLVAAVDWRGRLQYLQNRGGEWLGEAIPDVRLPPGAPVLVTTDRFGIHLSAVTMEGAWLRWGQGVRNVWTPETIAIGFPPGAFIAWDAPSATLFAVDALGRIVPAHFHEEAWHCHVCQMGDPFAPQLISRRFVPNPPLPPARVILTNPTREDMALQIADEQQGTDSEELTLAAGQSVQRTFQRDAGGVLEETYLVGSPVLGWKEQIQTYPLPAQSRYSVVVWAKRVTYQYIDKRKDRPQGAPPSFDLKTHVSIGAFSLPPGDFLADGTELDVPALAKSNRNPGAAALGR